MKIQNNYPEPEEMETVSLEDLLESESVDIEEDGPSYLEPDDGEPLDFEDKHRGWR